jgi:hypothetical protein
MVSMPLPVVVTEAKLRACDGKAGLVTIPATVTVAGIRYSLGPLPTRPHLSPREVAERSLAVHLGATILLGGIAEHRFPA